MPTECAMATCRNVVAKGTGITFHRFPKNTLRRNRWAYLMRRHEGWVPQEFDRVCSAHFVDTDFDRTGQTVRLRDNIEPSVFQLPVHLQKSVTRRETLNSISGKRPASPEEADDVVEVPVPEYNFNLEHAYTEPDGSSFKTKWMRAESRAEDMDRQLQNALAREKRSKATLSSYIDDLKAQQLMSEELQTKLDAFGDFPIHLFDKCQSYSEEQRKFALTLHLYGPKAYDYLRTKVNLPSPRTLTRWLSHTDGSAGINSSVLNGLQEKVRQDPSTYRNVALVLDAMSIRKQMIYDPREKKMTGFVDLGDGNESEDEASEALVFLVVGFKGHWKAPVAYYLTKGLSASTQKELLVHMLQALFDIGMRVWTLTMDGHPSNMSMCKQLGCTLSITNCCPKFQNPSDNSQYIYVILDPCHMLKLFRKMLSAYGCITSPTGRVEWRFIKDLQNLQEDAGLRLGNKLSQNHIRFQRQIMKVRLATQTLSSSVASALQFLQDSEHPNFQDAAATIEFIKIVDRLFDVFNSRNPVAKGYKSALRMENWNYTYEFLDSAWLYLSSLKTLNGELLGKSKRHTAVTGFVTNIIALQELFPHLLSTSLQYVLTYKFSQDHLELFFSAVRRAGGWNNNPNVQQFKTAFKRLAVHSGAVTGNTGNVKQLDMTDTVQYATRDLVSSDEGESPFVASDQILLDHDYSCWTPARYDVLIDNSVTYIAGWVVRKLMSKVKCDICKESLVSSVVPQHSGISYHLLELKNNGGLVIPSVGTVSIVHLAEKCIQRLMNIHSAKKMCSFPRVLMMVRRMIEDRDILNLSAHITDTQHGIDNHFSGILALLVEVYFDLRQHHIAKTYNIRQQGANIRQRCNKLVLFKGQ